MGMLDEMRDLMELVAVTGIRPPPTGLRPGRAPDER